MNIRKGLKEIKDSRGADEDDRKADKLKNIFQIYGKRFSQY